MFPKPCDEGQTAGYNVLLLVERGDARTHALARSLAWNSVFTRLCNNEFLPACLPSCLHSFADADADPRLSVADTIRHAKHSGFFFVRFVENVITAEH